LLELIILVHQWQQYRKSTELLHKSLLSFIPACTKQVSVISHATWILIITMLPLSNDIIINSKVTRILRFIIVADCTPLKMFKCKYMFKSTLIHFAIEMF
jgi:hypothetical protein